VVKEAKPIVVVVNKWDLVHAEFENQKASVALRANVSFARNRKSAVRSIVFHAGSALVFVSAMSGYEVDRMLNAAVQLNRQLDIKLPTAKLNQVLGYLTNGRRHRQLQGVALEFIMRRRRPIGLFASRFFATRGEIDRELSALPRSGHRGRIRLSGCPVYFDLVGKKRETERSRPAKKSYGANESSHETVED